MKVAERWNRNSSESGAKLVARGASGRRKREEDCDRRGSLEIWKSGQLFRCKRVRIKRLTGRRLPISTVDRGGGLSACVSEDLQ